MLQFMLPGRPIAKARAQITTRGNYTPASTKRYEVALGWQARVAMASGRVPPIKGPAFLACAFFLPTIKAPKVPIPGMVAGLPHTLPPDVDNLWKAVADALNNVAWVDDSHVGGGVQIKLWCEPGDARTMVWATPWAQRQDALAAVWQLATA